jgi:hypothetical protein
MAFSYTGAENVIAALKLIEVGKDPESGYSRITVEQGNRIGEIVAANGGYSTFVELDERPGQFDGNYSATGWHWKLRQARNDTRNDFFAIIADV